MSGNEKSQQSKMLNIRPIQVFGIGLLALLLGACSSGSDTANVLEEDAAAQSEGESDEVVEETVDPTAQDLALGELIERFALDADVMTSHLPHINDALPQLGMKLFYSKSLGGDFDAACVSCHHPALGGADGLTLPIGVDAVSPDLLGPGRENQDNLPLVPRNSPTVFNAGLWDTGLFWDSRVESIGKEPGTNGSVSGIRTPDTALNVADSAAGANLAAAQARFPVTSPEEMQGFVFEAGADGNTVRSHLAARIGGYGAGAGELDLNQWLVEFQTAFGVSAAAESLVTFDNIAHALGEYERSMVFVDSPWRQYLDGDLAAMSEDAKAGAVLFFTGVDEGGAGCAACHNGPLFSDGRHHNVAFPQLGPGKGDLDDDDFGRERETGSQEDRYRFRTPSLLNIAQTAPYGHAGSYTSLEEVVRHYLNPQRMVENLFERGGICSLPQYQSVEDCASLYPNNAANSEKALAKLRQERDDGVSRFESPRLAGDQEAQLIAFLKSLTDPCVTDRECVGQWIPDVNQSGPDGLQLNAVDQVGNVL